MRIAYYIFFIRDKNQNGIYLTFNFITCRLKLVLKYFIVIFLFYFEA